MSQVSCIILNKNTFNKLTIQKLNDKMHDKYVLCCTQLHVPVNKQKQTKNVIHTLNTKILHQSHAQGETLSIEKMWNSEVKFIINGFNLHIDINSDIH